MTAGCKTATEYSVKEHTPTSHFKRKQEIDYISAPCTEKMLLFPAEGAKNPTGRTCSCMSLSPAMEGIQENYTSENTQGHPVNANHGQKNRDGQENITLKSAQTHTPNASDADKEVATVTTSESPCRNQRTSNVTSLGKSALVVHARLLGYPRNTLVPASGRETVTTASVLTTEGRLN